MKVGLRGFLAGSLALATSLTAMGNAKADDLATALAEMKPTQLTFGNFVPPNSVLGKTYTEYGRMLERKSNGKIKVRFFWSGSLFPLTEALQSVSEGLADMGVVSGQYTPANTPLTAMLEHAYNASDLWVGQRATSKLHAGSTALHDELKRNGVKWVAPYSSGTYQFFFGKSAQWSSAQDFKGKTLRTTGGARSQWHSLLGAEPIFMGVNEIYEAADRGVVWGFENTLSLAEDFKQGEVTGTLLKVDSGVVMGAMTVMNQKRWESFPPAIQKLIIDTGVEWGETVQAKALIEREKSIVDAWRAKGIKVEVPNEQANKTLRDAARQAADAAAKSIDTSTGTDAGSKTLAELRALVEQAASEQKQNGYPWR